jgi:hypothetical protein
VRRARRLDEARVEISLMLTNNTSDSHSFQLPDPRFRWRLALNTADLQGGEQEIEHPAIDVAPHSVQLLTAIVAASVADSVSATAINRAAPSDPAPLLKEAEDASAAAVAADD